jgi:tRNA modification GTPase
MVADTIVALSTPAGTSGLAILRLSGPACRSILGIHFGRQDCEARHVYYGSFRTLQAEPIDRLNFVLFPRPASSTGEDVLEIYPHGNMLIVDQMLKSLLAHEGVRLAEAGEFTRRGFENGKIDLLQAEAIGELIHAQTIEALKNAQRIVGGALSGPLKVLRDDLLDLSARLELEVDFSEEEADPDFDSWIPRMESVQRSLKLLAKGFARGRGFARARRVAILGAPNAGKSSLINALVEEDRLLVSNTPGTTRDYVEVPLLLPGGMVHLVDTAGLGRPVDGLDEMAMERTRREWEKADVGVWIADGTSENNLPESEYSISLRIATKKDLSNFKTRSQHLAVSSLTGEGLAEFRSQLNAIVFADRGAGEDIVLTTERQVRAVEAAEARVSAALEGLRHKPAIEIIAFEVREATGHLKELLGEISSDEVLQRVFSGYCIGK